MVVGLTMVIVLINLVVRIGSVLYPQPIPLDWAEQAARTNPFQTAPFAARLTLACAWFSIALLGTVVAVWIGRRRLAALPPVALISLHATGSIGMSGAPQWLGWAAMLLPIAGALLGVRMASVGSARARP